MCRFKGGLHFRCCKALTFKPLEVCEAQQGPVNAAFGPGARQRLKVFDNARLHVLCFCRVAYGAAHGVRTHVREACGLLPDLRFITCPDQRQRLKLRFTARNRARLIKRRVFEVSPLFQVHPALHKHPSAGSKGERRDNRHGRRNHQSARAGNDKKHERPINPRGPGKFRHQGSHDSDRQSNHKDGRRIARRKLIHKTLQRRFLLFGFLDGADDARAHRVLRGGG